MDFSLSGEVREEAERALHFAKTRSGNRAPGLDRATWRDAAAAGLIKASLPTEWGGRGQGAMTAFAILHALGQGGMDRSLSYRMRRLVSCGQLPDWSRD